MNVNSQNNYETYRKRFELFVALFTGFNSLNIWPQDVDALQYLASRKHTKIPLLTKRYLSEFKNWIRIVFTFSGWTSQNWYNEKRYYMWTLLHDDFLFYWIFIYSMFTVLNDTSKTKFCPNSIIIYYYLPKNLHRCSQISMKWNSLYFSKWSVCN